MGGPPITLLKPGALVARMGEDQDELDKMIPLNYIMNWFDNQLDSKSASSMSDRIVILQSKTGSGKSTSIAPTLYLRFFKKYRKQIVITQPRVLTTVEIPTDISKIDTYKKPNKDGLSIELYRNLGYQTQMYVSKPKEKGILFVTTGILLQYLKNMDDDKFCKKFKFIIIDEAHDRSLDVDLILLMMKKLIKRSLKKEPPFLILMSATINVAQYSKYFNTKTIFEVNGQSKPIQTIYPSVDVDNIYSKSCEIIAGLDEYEKQNPSDVYEKGIRDVIIFMPSVAPIKRMIEELSKLNYTLKNKILPISITSADINGGTDSYASIVKDFRRLKVLVDDKLVPAYRRVIVSTNVAETGLTLESLRYCIDTALQFTNEFNPRHGINIMMTKPTTSSMSLQRKGRVGRKHPGVFYPLFTEETFNNMIVDNTPNIAVEDMSVHLLALIAREESTSDDLPVYEMLTPPSDDSVNYSLEKLFTLGAIDNTGKITAIGKIMNSFRKISVEASKMIVSGFYYDVSVKELAILAVLLNYRKSDFIIENDKTKKTSYDTAALLDDFYETPTFNSSICDTMNYNRLKSKLLIGCEMLELLMIYQRFKDKFKTLKGYKLLEWCDKKGLNSYTLFSIHEALEEMNWHLSEIFYFNPYEESNNGFLYQVLKRSGDVNDTELVEHVIKLKNCIYQGFKNNLLLWNNDKLCFQTLSGIDVVVKSKLVSQLSYQKIGANFEQDRPRALIYKEILTRQDPKSGQFIHEASLISVMDGYVHIDPDFIMS